MGAGQAEAGSGGGDSGAPMIAIRSCEGFDELEACVQLQIETWGMDTGEVVARKTFFLAQKIGGQVIGAFDAEITSASTQSKSNSLVGFVMALPGVKSGGLNGEPQPYLHSHMLAVRESYRNHGLGAQLKQEQRREALARGIRLIEWTFDPLEIKNAHLNIQKLGATACRYFENFYGASSSRLQGGLPTDRLLAEWRLDSPWVEAHLEGRPADAQFLNERVEERILVPAAIHLWKASQADRELASKIQLENRSRFKQAFSQGLAVLGFYLDAEGNGIFELGHPNRPEMASNPQDRKNPQAGKIHENR
jgi:predicted GNAT superfamily acetyltransferase